MAKQRSLDTILSAFVLGALTLAPCALAAAEAAQDHKDGKAKIEGTVKNVSGTCPNLRFVIAETRIVTKENTKFEDGTCDAVKNGERVEAKGKLDASGTLTAWKVELEDKD